MALRILGTSLLLALILWLIDWQQAASYLLSANALWLFPAVLLVQVQVFLSAWRWQVTAGRLGQHLSVPRAVAEYYLATAANLTLPGGVAGDAARVARNRGEAGWGLSAQGVILERFSGQLALFAVALPGWILWSVLIHNEASVGAGRVLLSFLVLLVAAGSVLALMMRFGNGAARRFIVSFRPAIHKVWMTDGQWRIQGCLSLLVVFSYLAVFAISAQAIGQPLPLFALLTLVPLVLLSMVLPVSVGGWGVREAVAGALWPLAGLSAEAGIATSVIYGIVSMIGVIPGVLVLLIRRRD